MSSAAQEIPRIYTTESSLPHSQAPAPCPYNEHEQSSPRHVMNKLVTQNI